MSIVKKQPLGLIWIAFLWGSSSLYAQYAPAAGKLGSTAIHKDSAVFIAWATDCDVYRGREDASNKASPFASFGNKHDAIGKADGSVVSLGDAGYAVLTFDPPIANGPGFDFAVFENGFSDTYLELAFVEVSSDGVRFVRFPSVSLTDTQVQVGTFGQVNPERIDNLAGKYRVFWGTPFDLALLADSQELNINAITSVRIIDVVGSITDSLASRDHFGRIINDPFPTAFESGGFDLDAVGVIHNTANLSTLNAVANENRVRVYPSPAYCGEAINVSSKDAISYRLYDMYGASIQCSVQKSTHSSFQLWESGVYLLQWEQENGTSGWAKIVVR